MAKDNNNVIGGEFAISYDLIQQKGKIKINAEDRFFYSSGRAALYAILKDIEHAFGKSGGVLLPDYLCDSVTNTIVDANWAYSFYHVQNDFHMDIESIKLCGPENKVIVLIDYFGMTDLTDDIANIRRKLPSTIVVADCVQAYYSMGKYDADYSFTSFRKWFPCPDGAMVIKKNDGGMDNVDFCESDWAEYKYAGNILKEYSCFVSDSIVLKLLEKGEEHLDKSYLCQWNEESKKLFYRIDKNAVQKKRNENAKYLHEQLKTLNIKHLYSEESTPLFIPILVDDRDCLRKSFFAENIFTPKHWPVCNSEINGVNELYDKELSLICDQRYDLEDMERQISVIKNIRGMII